MENSFLAASNNIKGIFFDAGNTLLKVHPSVGTIYAEAAKQFGADLSPEKIEESFKKMWSKMGPLVSNQGQRLTYEKEREWWKFIVNEVFRDHMEFEDFDAFFQHLYTRFAETACWRLYDDVIAVLQDLKRRGHRLAIISNWDSRLPSLLEQLNISEYFETVVVSALVGYEKPHPGIFRIALERTGLNPTDVLYIGDDPVLDYQAAVNVGIRALHLDRYDRFGPHQDRITSLSELALRL
jgi:putative hydrolase of the HAD superfamily